MKITVRFPDGDREINAHYESVEPFGYKEGPLPSIQKVVPDDIPGWMFAEDIAGNWTAHRTLTERD